MLASMAVVGILWLVSIVKIKLAVERGHRNIGFLILLILFFTFVAFRIASRVKRTKRGELFLSHMRSLFEGLRQRSSSFIPRANTIELLMLGAVFGMSALPSGAFPYTYKLYPRAASRASSSACGSSCGSSCGSGGSSCGSSCGGGGCGGGCGGCGS